MALPGTKTASVTVIEAPSTSSASSTTRTGDGVSSVVALSS
jgi:hypothetical protein